MLRVAAAEIPAVKWGGSDVSAYTAAPRRKSAAGPQTGEGDVFGRSLQVHPYNFHKRRLLILSVTFLGSGGPIK